MNSLFGMETFIRPAVELSRLVLAARRHGDAFFFLLFTSVLCRTSSLALLVAVAVLSHHYLFSSSWQLNYMHTIRWR